MIVAAADDVRQAEEVGEHGGRLERLEGILEDVGPLGEHADDVDSVSLGEKGEIGGGDGFVGELGAALDGAETSVGVLEVWAGIALEGGHGVHVEVVVVDAAGGELRRQMGFV